jgi:hypothetical protein
LVRFSDHDEAAITLCRRSAARFMRWDHSLPPDLVHQLWTEPHRLLDDAPKLQDKPRCTVALVEHAAGPYVCKYHNWGSTLRTIKRSLVRSTARKTWTFGRYLHAAGVPTPCPRAFVERRVGPFGQCSFGLADFIPGTSLYRFMRYEHPTRDVVRDLAQQVAAIWQTLDDLGIWHNDFKTENFLVDPDGKIWLIDLERTRRYRDKRRLRRRQTRDIQDLLHPRNWRRDPAAAEIFRKALLNTRAATATVAGLRPPAHPLLRSIPPVNQPSQLVSVVIRGDDGPDSLRDCVDSARDLADEILIASQGAPAALAVLADEFPDCRIVAASSESTRDASLQSLACRQAAHPWVLRVEPRERVSADLCRQVQDALATNPALDAFRIARWTYFHGRRLRFGASGDDAGLRLFRKQAAHLDPATGELRLNIPAKRIGAFRGRLYRVMADQFEDEVRHVLHAAARAARAASPTTPPARSPQLLARALWTFVKSYLFRAGWRDGRPGLHTSILSAFALYADQAIRCDLAQTPTLKLADAPRDDAQQPVEPPPEILSIFASQLTASDATEARPAQKPLKKQIAA